MPFDLAIVLVEPHHPGNIGSVARAMKNFGFSDLRLVNPCELTEETFVLAHRSTEILDSAKHFSTLEGALSDCSLVFATSNKDRSRLKSLLPQKAVEIAQAEGNKEKIALVFGREDKGLLNSEIEKANYLIKIPMAKIYPAINLSQAVLLLAYEFFSSQREFIDLGKNPKFATFEAKDHLSLKANKIINKIDFKPLKMEEKFKDTLSKTFARLPLTEKEAGIFQMLFTNILNEFEE